MVPGRGSTLPRSHPGNAEHVPFQLLGQSQEQWSCFLVLFRPQILWGRYYVHLVSEKIEMHKDATSSLKLQVSGGGKIKAQVRLKRSFGVCFLLYGICCTSSIPAPVVSSWQQIFVLYCVNIPKNGDWLSRGLVPRPTGKLCLTHNWRPCPPLRACWKNMTQ